MLKTVKDAMFERGINLREDWLLKELTAMSKQIDLHNLSTIEATGLIFTKLLLCDLKSEEYMPTFTISETSAKGQAKLYQVEKLWNISDYRVRLEDGSYTQPVLGHVNKLLLTDGQTNVLAYDFNGLLRAYQSKFSILRGCKVLLQNADMQQGVYILESKTACFLGGCIPDSLEEDVRPLSTLQPTVTTSSSIVAMQQEITAQVPIVDIDDMDVDITPFLPTQVMAKPEPRLTYFKTLTNKGWVRCFAARLLHASVSSASRQWEVIVELHDGAGSSAIARLHPTLAASKLSRPSPVTIVGEREIEIMKRFVGIFLVSVIASQPEQQVELEVVEEAIDSTPFLQFMQHDNEMG